MAMIDKSWIDNHKKRYQRLFDMTSIDYIDLGSKSDNLYAIETIKEDSSWWYNKIFIPPKINPELISQIIIGPQCKNASLNMLELNFYPSPEQVSIFRTWTHAYAFTYNKVVDMSNIVGFEVNLSEKDIIDLIVDKDNIPLEWEFLLDTPSEIRERAVSDACKLHNDNVIKFNNFEDNIVSLKFKTKKSRRFSMEVDIDRSNYSINEDGKLNIYPNILGDIKYDKNIIGISPKYDIKISFEKSYGWKVFIPHDIEDKKIQDKFIVFDPGYRTFLTGVDSDGKIRQFGVNWHKDILEKKVRLERLESEYEEQKQLLKNKNLTYKERSKIVWWKSKIKFLIDRISAKILNRVDYMHKKIGSDIVKEYKIVFLPKLDLVEKRKNITPEERKMMELADHYRFHRYLSSLRESKVVEVNEEFTTKVCARCMNLKEMKRFKIYNCEKCGYNADRDVNSAINILVKNIDLLKL